MFTGLTTCAFAVAAAQTAAHGGNVALAAQLHEAVLAAQHGDENSALQTTETLLAAHPNFGPALKFRGELLEAMGHPANAAASYEAALKLLPTDTELMLKVGIYRLLAGDKDGAIGLLTHRSKLVPRDGDTLYYLAQAYRLKGDNELALKTIEACVKVEPDNASVMQKYGELLCSSGDNEAGLRWLSKAQHADPTLDRIDFDLGVASYNNQDLEKAAQYGAKAVGLRPNDLKAVALLAAVDVKLARWTDAKPLFEQILAIKPRDTASLLGLGHCDLVLKNYEPAAESLERLLAQDPTQVLAHFYLARAYAGLGRTADAAHEADLHSKLLVQAASVVPSAERDIEKTTLVQARQLLTEDKETEALQLFRERSKGPEATPGQPYMLVGVVYLYMGRSEEAQRYLNKAMAIEPAVHDAHTYLGILALQQEDLGKAESEFKQELTVDPNSQLAVAELGAVRYRQGRWQEAADQLARSKTAEPFLLFMLCDSYFRLGKVREANLTAELIADYDKGDPTAVGRVVALLNRNWQSELAQRLAARPH